MSYRGARTFVARTLDQLIGALNTFAGDVQEGFRAVERDVRTLQTFSAQQITNSTAQTGVDPAVFTAGPVQPQKSGNYVVTATMTGFVSGADAIFIALTLDGVLLQTVSVSTAAYWAGTLAAVATVDPTVSHTWVLEASTGSGVNTINLAVDGARIVLVES